MINLSDVSIYYLHDSTVSRLAEEHNLKSVQDLINFVALHPEYRTQKLNCIINHDVHHDICMIRNSVEKYSSKGRTAEVYPIKDYKDKTLSCADEGTTFKVIPFYAPSSFSHFGYAVKNCQMSFIKDSLTLTTPCGFNYLRHLIRTAGDKKMQDIARYVDFYTEQVERLGKLTKSRDENLFYLDMKQRKECVTDNYAEIISYFLHNNEDFIWFKLNDTQKRILLKSIVCNSEEESRKIKEEMIRRIANYTTLPELEEVDKGNYSVLKRFTK